MQAVTGDCEATIVLGMHRSGTSCLAGCLQRRGLHLGSVQEHNPHNLRGNRENLRIMHLNDAVLAHGEGAWDKPPVRVSWTSEHAQERDLILQALRRNGSLWGFKDPRTLLVLPFWLDGIPAPRLVGTFRHPRFVAKSLLKRNRISPGVAFDLWYAYNSRMLAHHRKQPFSVLSFDVDDEAYRGAVDRIATGMGLRALGPGAEDFFDPGLRQSHQDLSSIPEPPPGVIQLYGELLNASRTCMT